MPEHSFGPDIEQNQPEDDESQSYVGGDNTILYFDDTLLDREVSQPGIRHGDALFTVFNLENKKLIPELNKGYFTIDDNYYFTAGNAGYDIIAVSSFSGDTYSNSYSYKNLWVLNNTNVSGVLYDDNIICLSGLLNRESFNLDKTTPKIESGCYFYENTNLIVNPAGQDFLIIYDKDDSSILKLSNININDYINTSFYFGVIKTENTPGTINIIPKNNNEMYNKTTKTLYVDIRDTMGNPILLNYFIYASTLTGLEYNADNSSYTAISADIDNPSSILCSSLSNQETLLLSYNGGDNPVNSITLYYSYDKAVWKELNLLINILPNFSDDIALYSITPLTYMAGLCAMGFSVKGNPFEGNPTSETNFSENLLRQDENFYGFENNGDYVTVQNYYNTLGVCNVSNEYKTSSQAFLRPPMPYFEEDTDAASFAECNLLFFDSQDLGGTYWYDVDKTSAYALSGVWTISDLAKTESFSGVLEDKVINILVNNLDDLYLDKRGFPLWYNDSVYKIPTDYNPTTNTITSGNVVSTPNFLLDKDSAFIKLGALWLRFTTSTSNVAEDIEGEI